MRSAMLLPQAAKILGKHIFGPQEWMFHFGYQLNSQELQESRTFPWDQDILLSPCTFNKGMKVFQTHFAFWAKDEIPIGENGSCHYLPWNIKNFSGLQDVDRGHFGNRNIDFQNAQMLQMDSMREKCESRWYLVPLDTREHFVQKNFLEQLNVMPNEYSVSPAIVEIMSWIICKKLSLPRNIENTCRCLIEPTVDDQITVYADGRKTILVGLEPLTTRKPDLSLAVNRRQSQ